MSKQVNRTAWITFGNWDGPVLELSNASWRINTIPRGGSYYTHTVTAQAPAQEIVDALREQFGIRELDCCRDKFDHNPLTTTIDFRNTKSGGIGGPDYTLRRIRELTILSV